MAFGVQNLSKQLRRQQVAKGGGKPTFSAIASVYCADAASGHCHGNKSPGLAVDVIDTVEEWFGAGKGCLRLAHVHRQLSGLARANIQQADGSSGIIRAAFKNLSEDFISLCRAICESVECQYLNHEVSGAEVSVRHRPTAVG